MKSSVIAIAFVLAACGSSNAQQALGIGTGIGVARSSSNAQSFSSSSNRNFFAPSVTQQVTVPTSFNGRNAGATNSGNRTQTVLTNNSGNFNERGIAPSVFAPSVGNSSPCDSYISLGGSGIGGGGAFAFPWQNHNCDMRANALVLQQLGMGGVARQRMCYDDDTAQTMAAMGFVCRVGKYAPQPQQTAYVTAGAAPLPPVNGDFFYDKRGRRYRSVPCTAPHQTHAASGECLTRN
jgi:hypothetical protein